MITPLAQADSVRIGSVDFVSPDEVKVLLDIEAPNDVALNTGIPRPFPRINSYILIPSESGFLVAQIEWITIERSQYPKRKGMQDFGVIDLPYPLRKMSLNPLGVLRENGKVPKGEPKYSFSRGVELYPTVGDPVLLPSQTQLKAIVESSGNRRVNIGISPLAGNAVVSIDPDRLFGRHLAILGNTGSGKSCSVAGVIRWSIEAAKQERQNTKSPINTRFIILDPNGEYSHAFSGLDKVRLFAVEAVEPNEEQGIKQVEQLKIPLWFWNSAEWSAFTQATAKTQRPILRRALRDIRMGATVVNTGEETQLLALRRYLSYQIVKMRRDMANNSIKEDATKFGYYLKTLSSDLSNRLAVFPKYNKEIKAIIIAVNDSCQNRYKSFVERKSGETVEYYTPFENNDIQTVVGPIETLISKIGGIIYQEEGVSEDTPLHFNVNEFADYIQMLGIEENTSQFIDFLVMRIRALISDRRIREISDADDMTLNKWLEDYICKSNSSEGSVTVIDLSLVPAEVVHIITAVIARMVLEALQRYRKLNGGQTLPTTLVMEEAHTFIKRYQNDSEESSASSMCTRVFEKIAREGRKFGLGLVLSSQRPSELSPTVLSQCNTFLLHRISNDRDQDLVHKLVPDNLRGLLRELPSLPSRNAILLGWASELPVMVQMNYLKEEHRPQSNDPDYWDIWTGKKVRTADWKAIADDWQQLNRNTEGIETSADEDEADDLPF
ncbi:DUF87 domain-containing protein [Pelotomaculum isophthalicicum JI]|uniref:DUF87 domain-containing protein n=1 Tax=Pelotomaculum isophthalicicum JI TaxID=947010 RepID=A0A9X4JUA7_9FIRM|nr:DUF87 domain-containing protein [Pelotomaculum isophthalicicum]MDF9408815.1 DUF87 domain-containing protein [Pelotomaculum isophthalicicum JI]